MCFSLLATTTKVQRDNTSVLCISATINSTMFSTALLTKPTPVSTPTEPAEKAKTFTQFSLFSDVLTYLYIVNHYTKNPKLMGFHIVNKIRNLKF